MTLQLLHSEFPYTWGKFDFLFLSVCPGFLSQADQVWQYCSDQCCGSGYSISCESGYGSGFGSRVLWQKTGKNTAKEFIFFKSKIAIYLSLGLSYRRSLKPSKENIRNFKILNLLTYSIWWVIFALLNPDPDANPIRIRGPLCIRIQPRSGSTTLVAIYDRKIL